MRVNHQGPDLDWRERSWPRTGFLGKVMLELNLKGVNLVERGKKAFWPQNTAYAKALG